MCVYVDHICTEGCGVRRGIKSPRSGVVDGSKLHMGAEPRSSAKAINTLNH